jgi:hypothetical protein
MTEFSRDFQIYADFACRLNRAIESGDASAVERVWDEIIPVNYCVVISEKKPGYSQLYGVLRNKVDDFRRAHEEVVIR